MLPLTEPEIRRAFVNCSVRERRDVRLPKLDAVDWERRDYLGWRDLRSDAHAYLVADLEQGPVGIFLGLPSGKPPAAKAMCDLCRAHRTTSEVRLMVARRAGKAGKDGNTVGSYLCTDFACADFVRKPVAPGLGFPAETSTEQERRERLMSNLESLMRRVRA